MHNLQELGDRLEIQQTLMDYANAIDRRDWDALDAVFTPDAYIDYRAMGGIDGRYPQIKRWLAEVLPKFPAYYHLVGNFHIELAGARARSRCACFNPMALPLPGGGTQVMFLGLWYADEWVRTPAGWRIERRVEEKCFDHNTPQGVRVEPS
ncbi:MAG: nuclear transport factor 2 family protein [Sinobacteraceae bacterium]|nr:nuclear transport factor 2 family protein [Nevskia sp.]MDI3258777.1 nuclear transport factor 2 family protein [Nevskiaceae bacterium]